jgi:hypothetical protein
MHRPSCRHLQPTTSGCSCIPSNLAVWCMHITQHDLLACDLFPERLCPPPLPQEQTRAFVESILPRAQQVAPTVPTAKKTAAGGAAAGAQTPPAPGGMGAKEAAAKQAAARLPKLKKARSKAAAAGAGGGGPAGGEMSAILEASREGSSLPVPGASGSRGG